MAAMLKLDLRSVQAMLRAGKATFMLRRWASREEAKRRRKIKHSEVEARQIGLGRLGFRCDRLGCCMSVAVCVARQRKTEDERSRRSDLGQSSSPRKRGTAFKFPTCDTLKCELGRALRQQFGDECAAKVRGGERSVLTMHPGGAT